MLSTLEVRAEKDCFSFHHTYLTAHIAFTLTIDIAAWIFERGSQVLEGPRIWTGSPAFSLPSYQLYISPHSTAAPHTISKGRFLAVH